MVRSKECFRQQIFFETNLQKETRFVNTCYPSIHFLYASKSKYFSPFISPSPLGIFKELKNIEVTWWSFANSSSINGFITIKWLFVPIVWTKRTWWALARVKSVQSKNISSLILISKLIELRSYLSLLHRYLYRTLYSTSAWTQVTHRGSRLEKNLFHWKCSALDDNGTRNKKW